MNPAGGNVAQTSANAYNMATGTAAAGTQYNPAQNTAPYQNQYRQQVIDKSLGTLDRANQMALNRVGGNATMQGAFGGARHGIAEAETNRAFADQAGTMAAGLNAQGFDNAQNAAMGDANFRLQSVGALGNLSQQGFNMGRTINNDMLMQGSMQQGLQQQLIDAARGQYQGYTQAPQQALQAYAGALGAQPDMGTVTSTSTPGIFDYLSAGSAFAGSPGGAGLLMAMCWVAREVYGPENPEWLEFREWMIERAPRWLFRLYARHGEWFARVVRRAPVLKRLLRPMMDKARALL